MANFDQRIAAEYESKSKKAVIGYDALYEVMLLALQVHLKAKSQPRILILGAGTGTDTIKIAAEFPGAKLVAIDPSDPMLEMARANFAREKIEVEVHCGTLESFPNLVGFDVIVCIGVVHHVNSIAGQEGLLTDIVRAVAPGGMLVVASHIGDFDGDTRFSMWMEHVRRCGASEEEVAGMRQRLEGILPVSERRWLPLLQQVGFQRNTRLFSSLFFEVWSCKHE